MSTVNYGFPVPGGNDSFKAHRDFKALGDAIDTTMHTELSRTNQQVDYQKYYINVREFGAVGDGTTNDAPAIQAAINQASTIGPKTVFFPDKTYLLFSPLRIPQNVTLRGVGPATVLKKSNTTTVTIDNVQINSILITEGYKITLEDLGLEGSIANNVNGITFGNGTAMITMNRVMIRSCKRAYHDFKSLWIAEFNKIHIVGCPEAFVLKENIAKTTLTFKDCWAENCGQAYELYRANYSSLINCAADWANYIAGTPYTQGYGDQATPKGVYNFSLCRGVTLEGVGLENCYGNGAVYANASNISINGLTVYNLKSEFVPNYTNNPNWAIGPIQTGTEKTKIDIKNVYIDNFVNDVVAINYPTKTKGLIAYNYSTGAYGTNAGKMIIVNSITSGTLGIQNVAGMGPVTDVLLLDRVFDQLVIKDYIELGELRQFRTVALTGSSATKLRIPVTAQSNSNTLHYIRLRGLDNTPNTNTPKSFYADITFNSLSTVTNVAINTATSGIVASGNGTALEVTLPATYSNLLVECSLISRNKNLVDFLNATLV